MAYSRISRSLPLAKHLCHGPTTIAGAGAGTWCQMRRASTYGYEQAKALVYSTNGEPQDVLSLHSHSLSPAHSSLITARFLASPINPADINTIQGTYPSKPPFTTSLSTATPVAVPGNEGLAQVLSAGAQATTDPSDANARRVQKGDWILMKGPCMGTWRTHIQAPAEKFLVLDAADREGISPVQAATVSVNPCTAYAMLKGWTGAGARAPDPATTLRPGDWFIQNGANSGVGRAAIQLGRAWGLQSINVVRARPEGEEATEALRSELKSLGADVVITEDEAAEKGFTSRVRDEFLAGSEGKLRLALNCVGGRSALNLAKVLSPGANHVTYGAMAKQPLSLPAGILIFRDTAFSGFWVSEWARQQPVEKMAAVKEVLGLIRAGSFKDAPVDEVRWQWATEEGLLKSAVQGTLEGFRAGKGVFVFEDA